MLFSFQLLSPACPILLFSFVAVVLAAPAGAPAPASAGGGRICFVDKLRCEKSNKTMERFCNQPS